MTNLFATTNNEESMNGANQLEKTAQLTSQAGRIANQMLKLIESADDENKADIESRVKASMSDHNEMDELIATLVDLQDEDIDYLKAETEGTLDKMVKSQQSKRSRSKSKLMTMDNYRTMLIGAIAENLLRIALNKPKSAAGFSGVGTTIYSVDELTKLSMNKEELAKAIRNVQSKKSIAKSKIGFTVDSEKWQQLLMIEAQLKTLRDGAAAQKPILDARLFKLEEVVKDVEDVSALKAADAKELLATILDLINPKTSDDTTDGE